MLEEVFRSISSCSPQSCGWSLHQLMEVLQKWWGENSLIKQYGCISRKFNIRAAVTFKSIFILYFIYNAKSQQQSPQCSFMVTCPGSCCYSSSSAFLLTTWINVPVHPKSPKTWYPHCVCEVWVQLRSWWVSISSPSSSVLWSKKLTFHMMKAGETFVFPSPSLSLSCSSENLFASSVALQDYGLCSRQPNWRRFSVVSCLMTRRKGRLVKNKNGFTSG